MNVEIVRAVGSGWLVLVNGFQWGPPGAKIDKSGAADTVFDTRDEAVEAVIAEFGDVESFEEE
jgi:hypothetical protein